MFYAREEKKRKNKKGFKMQTLFKVLTYPSGFRTKEWNINLPKFPISMHTLRKCIDELSTLEES